MSWITLYTNKLVYQVATSISLRCPSCNGLKEPGSIIFLSDDVYVSANKKPECHSKSWI